MTTADAFPTEHAESSHPRVVRYIPRKIDCFQVLRDQRSYPREKCRRCVSAVHSEGSVVRSPGGQGGGNHPRTEFRDHITRQTTRLATQPSSHPSDDAVPILYRAGIRADRHGERHLDAHVFEETHISRFLLAVVEGEVHGDRRRAPGERHEECEAAQLPPRRRSLCRAIGISDGRSPRKPSISHRRDVFSQSTPEGIFGAGLSPA